MIESDLASQSPLKKHKEWCLSRRSKKGEKGDSGGARRGCREKQEARGARPHWLSGGPVHLMTSLPDILFAFQCIKKIKTRPNRPIMPPGVFQ